MIPEKLEDCPDCQKQLSQSEYDGQHCSFCKTNMGFAKAKGGGDLNYDNYTDEGNL